MDHLNIIIWITYTVYVIESAAYGVLFTSCLCQKPSLASTSLVRVFDTSVSKTKT